MNSKLRILHLEDLPADAEIVERVLRKAGFCFEKKVVIDKPSFIRALHDFRPDIILSDHSLPAFNSLEALTITREQGISVPFILVTATVSEEYAVSVIKEGASDYILKDRLERLPSAIQNALEKTQIEADKRKAHAELARQAEIQRRLIAQTSIQVQEKERDQIGKELHDNISQLLAAAKLYMDLAFHTSSEEAVTRILLKSYQQLTAAMEEIRKLSQTLVAPSLGGISLDTALAKLVAGLPEEAPLQLDLDTTGYSGDIMDEDMKLTCYRIVQVQLANIIKHAHAGKATIRLSNADNLELTIADNGIGFDPHQDASGIGLRNIRNRVNFYNGDVQLDSAPGEGCTLSVTIPLSAMAG